MSRIDKEPKTMLRLASLLLALLVWVNFSGRKGNEDIERFVHVPLAFENQVENTKLVAETYQFQVTLSGSQKDLDALRNEDVKIRIDLRTASPGVNNFSISSKNVTMPEKLKSLKVGMIIPQSVKFTIIQTMEKEVSLFVFPNGKPAENYEFIDLQVTPPKITIVGPVATVSELDQLVPDSIDISGANKNLSGRIQFDYERQIGRDVVIKNNPEINYTVFISEKQSSRSFAKTYELDPPDLEGYTAKKTSFKLAISGPITAVDWFKPEWVVPIITRDELQRSIGERALQAGQDLENASPDGDQEKPANADLPLNVLVTYRLAIPEEERAAWPELSEKAELLKYKWTPEVVEVGIK